MRSALVVAQGADMNYSIQYLNHRCVTERSEILGFGADAAAALHAEIELPRHFVVEVRREDTLLSRSFRHG